MEAKLEAAKEEARTTKNMADQMLSSRISPSSRLKALQRRATDRVTYLVKCRDALRAGYVMMPDMPGDVVAVRTNRTSPTPMARRAVRSQQEIPKHPPDAGLGPGIGRYVSPLQSVASTEEYEVERKRWDGSLYKEKARDYWAHGLRDPDGLNKVFVKPQVVDRLTGAMSTLIFDEIVCVRPADTRRQSRDPIVLGRVVNGRQVAAFLIAWFVDPSEI